MYKIIGYFWEGDDYEIPIIKKDDGKYYRQYPKTEQHEAIDEEFEKEKFQYAMTTPWESMQCYHKKENNEFKAYYVSPMYDWIRCKIVGTGETLDKAMCNLIENTLDVMEGYNERKVKKFMDQKE